jgi:ribonuclease HI
MRFIIYTFDTAIDAVMNLTHDIELSLKEKKSTTCVFLDIKKAYDYVSLKQLLSVMKKLHLSFQIFKWIKKFINCRSIELTFDEKKQEKRHIRTKISQKSSISSILFLIYTRFLFAKLKIDVNIETSSFVNDIVIYTSSKKIEINCERLNQAISKTFDWARENVIKFDDFKSEMIHFELKKKMSSNSITLSNETTLRFQKNVKWLKIYIDKKLNFKEHVSKKIANATKALYSINRLQNTEWELSSMTSRQLYMICTNAISNYDSEIWWKNQKQFRNKLQKLQNIALKKILEAFRISFVAVMKIETNLKSIDIRLNQKKQKLELKMLKMKTNHSIKMKISNFSLKNWNETRNEQSKKFSEWNQNDLHATQLIKTIHSISKFITDEYLIEESASIKNIWKKSSLKIEIDSNVNVRDNHLKKVETILQINATIFYTNAAYDSKSKIATASCVLYQNSRTTYKTWNLEVEMSINDAKLYAIEKATKWSKTLQNFEPIWIFSDSQTAIRCIEKFFHFLAEEIHKTIENSNSQTHIHWILEHADISENEKANKLAKSIFSSSTITRNRFLSFKFLNNQITEHNHQRWLNNWKINSKKKKHYEKFDTILENSKIQLLSKKFTKHVISTILQLKFEHEYFKSYLVKLSKYETNKCNENCNFIQTSKHLLLHCRHFINQRSVMINEMKSQTTTLKTLFEIKKDIENLKKFLIDIEIVTRKWILRDTKENEENE